MDSHLQDYVKHYDLLDAKMLTDILFDLDKSNKWQENKYYNSSTGEALPINGENECLMLTSPVSCEIALRQKIYAAVHDYVQEINFDWWSAWNGITRPRFNRYLPGQLMHKHCDHIHSIFDGQRKGVPVLTVLGFLREDFTGGEFVLWDDSVIEHKAGTAIIFPANFMYPHEVKKVKSGIRDTFVSWVY